MHPILFEIGPFTLRWYGTMIATACLVGYWVARGEAQRKSIAVEKVEEFLLFAIVAAVIGARLYYVVFTEPELFWNDPLKALAVWRGGLAIHGAILGGLIVSIVFTRIHKISFWKFADTLAPSLILGQAIGRIGCLFNGDAHGYPTDMPWGMIYAPDSPAGQMFPDQPLHPTQLYEMIFNLIIFGILWKARTKLKTKGHLFLLYVIFYSIGRIIVEHFRADRLTYWENISAAQSLGFAGILVALILLIVLIRQSAIVAS